MWKQSRVVSCGRLTLAVTSTADSAADPRGTKMPRRCPSAGRIANGRRVAAALQSYSPSPRPACDTEKLALQAHLNAAAAADAVAAGQRHRPQVRRVWLRGVGGKRHAAHTTCEKLAFLKTQHFSQVGGRRSKTSAAVDSCAEAGQRAV